MAKHFITHLIHPSEGLPSSNGLRKVFYYNTVEDSTEIFMSTDNNPIDPEEVARFVSTKELIPFKTKVLLPEGQTLWINKQGCLYFCNRLDMTDKKTLVAIYDINKRELDQKIQ